MQIRWFDGAQWSAWVRPGEDETTAQRYAEDPSVAQKYMFWTDRWWLNQPKGFPK